MMAPQDILSIRKIEYKEVECSGGSDFFINVFWYIDAFLNSSYTVAYEIWTKDYVS